MLKPHFIFTQLANSFRVHIPNLEDLSVADIQAIEAFVQERKGLFDFNTYSFVIQKRLDYEEFVKLIDRSDLNVSLENRPVQKASKPRIGFGQYKGVFYSELPDSYLLWLENNYIGADKKTIEAEIKRRSL